ncbi:MAG: hypothetical protein ACHQZR_07405, partial [Candidatus Limnocylindrales bacterium]
MSGAIWAVAEVADGQPTRLSLELATLARELALAAGREAAAVVIDVQAAAAAPLLADYLPSVLAVGAPEAADHAAAAVIAPLIAALIAQYEPSLVLLGASPDGKDVAGALAALLDWNVLVNGAAVRWVGGAPTVEMSTFGGRLVTQSAPTTSMPSGDAPSRTSDGSCWAIN